MPADGECTGTDRGWLRRALALARRGPMADANPRVGCLLVAGEDLVGQGWHRGAGTPHAEVEALTQAGVKAGGATAYVTLEPCGHTGRTGPCAQALIDAGIDRVVYAQTDPNPVAAGGAAMLRTAGIEAIQVDLPGARELNADWIFAVRHDRPFVVWKYAATLDGRSAAADGTSQWITADAARADVHEQRARCGAVVLGTGSALADNPHLSVRRPDQTLRTRQPLRVIVGDRRLPPDARVLDDAAETVLLPASDPAEILAELHRRGVRRVWLEGGPTLAAAFLRAGLVDEVVAYLAPALLGAGPAAVGDLGITTMSDVLRLTPIDVTRVGDDLRIIARPHTQEG